MARLTDTLDSLLHGALSRQAQGFLLVLPPGTTAKAAVDRALRAAYATLPHPDVFTLLPAEGKTTIGVDQVRDALAFAHTHPTSGKMKTLWVPEADGMTGQAANAFLKTLEEPSGKTRVVLGSSRPERLLPTTRSRCIALSVRGDAAFALEELAALAPEHGDGDRRTALEATHGAVDAAATLLASKGGLAWVAAARKALDTGALLPVPPLGNGGLDAPTLGLVLQTLLARALPTGGAKAEARMDAALPYLSDMNRVGLDTAGRVRALARALHAA